MAGLGRKVFTAGEVLTAANVNGYLMDQSVMVFDDSGARGSAIGTATEGMVAYIKDENPAVQVFDGTQWTAVASQSPNYIINGAFDIWQRGTSFSPTSAKLFQADRWVFQYGGGTPTTVSLTQETFTPADVTATGYGEGQFYVRNTITDKGAATSLRNQHYVEDVRTLAGQTVTVSYFSKATGTNPNTRPYFFQNFGSGGSTEVFVAPSLVAETLTSSWVRYVYTFTLPSISGKTIGAGNYLQLRILNESLTNGDVIDIWGVQLEAGSGATPFRRNANSIQGELAACQRYYYRVSADGNDTNLGNGQCVSTTEARLLLPLKQTMRVEPTFSRSGDSGIYNATATRLAVTSVTYSGASNVNTARFSVFVAAGLVAGNATLWETFNDGAAYIEFSAEL
jgi:hypothetical protein